VTLVVLAHGGAASGPDAGVRRLAAAARRRGLL
jgi:hypothetical protein